MDKKVNLWWGLSILSQELVSYFVSSKIQVLSLYPKTALLLQLRSKATHLFCPCHIAWASLVAQLGSIRELGRSPGERNGYPLQYSGLKNSMDLTVAKSQTRLSGFHMKWSEIAQSCPTLCDPMDSSLHQSPRSMGSSRQEYWSGLLLWLSW